MKATMQNAANPAVGYPVAVGGAWQAQAGDLLLIDAGSNDVAALADAYFPACTDAPATLHRPRPTRPRAGGGPGSIPTNSTRSPRGHELLAATVNRR